MIFEFYYVFNIINLAMPFYNEGSSVKESKALTYHVFYIET